VAGEADTQTLMRAVLAEAATCFGDVPGVEVVDEGDLVRSFAPGRPQPYMNGVARLDVTSGEALVARIGALEEPYRAAGLPTSWWADDTTRPADAETWFERAGLRLGGGEAVMALDLASMPGAALHAGDPATTEGVTVSEVETMADLDAWIGVMAGSYGWGDTERATLMRELYDPRTPHGSNGLRVQVLARLGGVAVGGASLFQTAGQGWVTNVGTMPVARGRGVGGAVTVATLRLALERGNKTAWLAASAMGEPVYRRLGFATVGHVSHWVGPATLP